jgi:hypothetical protein
MKIDSRSDVATRHVLLRGGLMLRVDALQLAWSLEDRGVRLSRTGEQLIVEPASALTADEVVALRRLKPHVLAALDYCDIQGWEA